MTSLLDRPAAARTPSRFPATPSSAPPASPRGEDAPLDGAAQVRLVPHRAAGSALIAWHDAPHPGEDGSAAGEAALRGIVEDHVVAAGALLTDAAELGADDRERCALHLCTPAAMLADPPRPGPARLLVVTDGPVSEPVWRRALEHGAAAVVRLPGDSARLLSLLGASLRPRDRAQLVGVVGGCGGAGASSLAARLAAAAARTGTTVLIDADPLGGGLDVLVEAPELRGACWEDLAGIDAADGEALVEGLPEVDDVRLLVAREDPAPSGAQLDHVLAAVEGLTGQVIVDLAPDLVGPAVPHLDRLYVVMPASDHALRAAARRSASWHLPAGIAEVVLRGHGPVTPSDVREELHLGVAGRFRDSSRALVPLLDQRRGGADRLSRRLVASWEQQR